MCFHKVSGGLLTAHKGEELPWSAESDFGALLELAASANPGQQKHREPICPPLIRMRTGSYA